MLSHGSKSRQRVLGGMLCVMWSHAFANFGSRLKENDNDSTTAAFTKWHHWNELG